MTRLPKLTAALLAASLAVFSATASADFTSGMSQDQVSTEVASMLGKTNPTTNKPYTLLDVAQAAKAAGITAEMFTTASIAEGSSAPQVTTAAIATWGIDSASQISVAAANAAPGQVDAIVTAAATVAPTKSNDIVAAITALPQFAGQTQAIQTAAANGVLASGGATGAGGAPGGGGVPVGTPAPALGGGAGAGGGGGGGVASPA